MSNNVEALGSVLSEIIANRTNIATQLENSRKQIAAGEVQLQRFDALIAALQVVTGDAAIQSLIEQQIGANAALTGNASSPTDAAPEADAPVAAPVADSSATDDYASAEPSVN